MMKHNAQYLIFYVSLMCGLTQSTHHDFCSYCMYVESFSHLFDLSDSSTCITSRFQLLFSALTEIYLIILASSLEFAYIMRLTFTKYQQILVKAQVSALKLLRLYGCWVTNRSPECVKTIKYMKWRSTRRCILKEHYRFKTR